MIWGSLTFNFQNNNLNDKNFHSHELSIQYDGLIKSILRRKNPRTRDFYSLSLKKRGQHFTIQSCNTFNSIVAHEDSSKTRIYKNEGIKYFLEGNKEEYSSYIRKYREKGNKKWRN